MRCPAATGPDAAGRLPCRAADGLELADARRPRCGRRPAPCRPRRRACAARAPGRAARPPPALEVGERGVVDGRRISGDLARAQRDDPVCADVNARGGATSEASVACTSAGSCPRRAASLSASRSAALSATGVSPAATSAACAGGPSPPAAPRALAQRSHRDPAAATSWRAAFAASPASSAVWRRESASTAARPSAICWLRFAKSAVRSALAATREPGGKRGRGQGRRRHRHVGHGARGRRQIGDVGQRGRRLELARGDLGEQRRGVGGQDREPVRARRGARRALLARAAALLAGALALAGARCRRLLDRRRLLRWAELLDRHAHVRRRGLAEDRVEALRRHDVFLAREVLRPAEEHRERGRRRVRRRLRAAAGAGGQELDLPALLGRRDRHGGVLAVRVRQVRQLVVRGGAEAHRDGDIDCLGGRCLEPAGPTASARAQSAEVRIVIAARRRRPLPARRPRLPR